MATEFIARVQLHADALPIDYETVHALMKTCGFERWVIGAESEQPFLLPHGTYVGSASLSRKEAFDMVKEALTVAFPTVAYSLIIAEATGIVFEGLLPVV